MTDSTLPTVTLVDGAMYWIKDRYGPSGLWTVAKWECGSFWGVGGKEAHPHVISGPIPAPQETSDVADM